MFLIIKFNVKLGGSQSVSESPLDGNSGSRLQFEEAEDIQMSVHRILQHFPVLLKFLSLSF